MSRTSTTEQMYHTAPLETEDSAGREAFAAIVKAVRELKQSEKLAAEEDENLIAEVLWTGIHGVVSLKLIYPAFPATDTKTLVEKMIQTLLDGLQIKR